MVKDDSNCLNYNTQGSVGTLLTSFATTNALLMARADDNTMLMLDMLEKVVVTRSH